MNERDEALGRLTDELAEALAVGEAINAAAWAARFGVAVADVDDCRRALQALGEALGEEVACGHPELPRPALPGYTIEGELGRGGMGVVYRAQQDKLGRPVAIKVLRPGDLVFGDALARFRSEAKSLARLRHRHIVSVHDVGETAEGLLWFAMDLIDGEPLAAEIARLGALLPARAVRILRQVTSAIAHAHAMGVVHRDLKPHNVLIDRQGDAYVVDFGLARDAASVSVHTHAGQLLGTPQYMSPEQAKGDIAAIGEASDVWALGALLYECLGGRGPFAGLPLHETMRAILEDEPRSLRSLDARVPAPLAAVAGKALQKRPQDRYGSALAFGEELERFAQGEPVLAKPPSRTVAVVRRAWRQRRSVASAVAAVLAVVGWFLWFVLPGLQQEMVLAAATKAIDGGFPGAAVGPLRELRAELVRDKPMLMDEPMMVRCEQELLRALGDRVGELLLASRTDEALQTAKLAWQATSGARAGVGWMSAAFRWQSWRSGQLATVLQAPMGIDLPHELQGQMLAALASSRAAERLVAQRLGAACGRMDWLEGAGDDVVLPFVISLHELAAVRLRGTFLRVPGVLWREEPGSIRLSRRPVVEALAASLAKHADDVDYHRVVLGTMFQAFGLPPLYWLDRGPPRWVDDDALRADARAWSAALVAAATEPSAATFAAIRERMSASFLGADLRGSPSAADLRAIVGVWTGHRGRAPGAEALRQWISEHREAEPRTWLGAAVGVQSVNTIEPAELLDRACREQDATLACSWWQLLRLRTPAAVDVPLCPPPRGERLQPWRRAWQLALGIEDARQVSVQVALLHFADGSPEPELLGADACTTAIGKPFHLAAAAPLFVPSMHVARRSLFGWRSLSSAGEPAFPQQAAFGEVRGEFRGIVREDVHGIYLGLDRQQGGIYSVTMRAPDSPLSGHYGSSRPRLRPGHAASGDWDYASWGEPLRWADFVLLVRLAPPGDDAMPDLAEWRASYLRQLTAAHERSNRDGFADVMTAALWPMPEALAELEAQVAGQHLGPHWSLPLAGAAAPATAWPRPQYGGDAALVRLALGSAASATRDLALAALADGQARLTAGPAARLLRAHEQGRLTLPSELLAKVRTAMVSRTFSTAVVLTVSLLVMTLVGFVVSLFVRRWRGVGAVVGLLGCCVLLFVELRIDGVVVLPANVALAGVLVGIWRAPVGHGVRWRTTMLATAVVLTFSLAWDAGLASITLHDYAPETWLLVLVGLTLLQLLVGDTTRQVRAARTPAAS